MVEGLFFNSSKQNLNATFFILFIILFSTGYQQLFNDECLVCRVTIEFSFLKNNPNSNIVT